MAMQVAMRTSRHYIVVMCVVAVIVGMCVLVLHVLVCVRVLVPLRQVQ